MLSASLDGRGVCGRTDTCVCTAESLCRSPETITTLITGCTPIKNAFGVNKKLKKKIQPGRETLHLGRQGRCPGRHVALFHLLRRGLCGIISALPCGCLRLDSPTDHEPVFLNFVALLTKHLKVVIFSATSTIYNSGHGGDSGVVNILSYSVPNRILFHMYYLICIYA